MKQKLNIFTFIKSKIDPMKELDVKTSADEITSLAKKLSICRHNSLEGIIIDAPWQTKLECNEHLMLICTHMTRIEREIPKCLSNMSNMQVIYLDIQSMKFCCFPNVLENEMQCNGIESKIILVWRYHNLNNPALILKEKLLGKNQPFRKQQFKGVFNERANITDYIENDCFRDYLNFNVTKGKILKLLLAVNEPELDRKDLNELLFGTTALMENQGYAMCTKFLYNAIHFTSFKHRELSTALLGTTYVSKFPDALSNILEIITSDISVDMKCKSSNNDLNVCAINSAIHQLRDTFSISNIRDYVTTEFKNKQPLTYLGARHGHQHYLKCKEDNKTVLHVSLKNVRKSIIIERLVDTLSLLMILKTNSFAIYGIIDDHIDDSFKLFQRSIIFSNTLSLTKWMFVYCPSEELLPVLSNLYSKLKPQRIKHLIEILRLNTMNYRSKSKTITLNGTSCKTEEQGGKQLRDRFSFSIIGASVVHICTTKKKSSINEADETANMMKLSKYEHSEAKCYEQIKYCSIQQLCCSVALFGYENAIQNIEENLTDRICYHELNATMECLNKVFTYLRSLKLNSSFTNERICDLCCDTSQFCQVVTLSADERESFKSLIAHNETSLLIHEVFSTYTKHIPLNGIIGITDAQVVNKLSNGLLFYIICGIVAYNLIYVIPNKSKGNIVSKLSIVCSLNILLITISLNDLYIEYSNKRLCKKPETCDKQLPKSAIYEAIDNLQSGNVKHAKQLLHDIIHYNSVTRSDVIQSYPVVRGDLSNELIRVGTLSAFPDESCPSLIRLAESGFYYDGKGRELKCFSCGLRYDDWVSNTIPLDVHRQLSPECPYVKQRFPILAANTDSQPNIEADSSGSRGLCTDSYSNVPTLLTSSSALPVTVTNGLDIDSTLSDSFLGRSSCISSRQSSNNSVITSSSRSSGYSSGYGSQASSGYSSGNISQGSSGYSSGYSSSSQTGSSNGILGSQSQLPAVTEGDEEQISERNYLRDNNIQPDSNRNTPREKYPEYKRRETRLATYKTWPSHLNFLYPQDLTECGFFYSNFGDCVRCFQCGIGLRNWEHDDNPWVEHARWSRKCPYLLQRKGQGFIDSVLSVLGLQTDAEIEEQVLNSTLDRSTSGSSASNDVRDPITHPAAQYVINEQIFGTNVDRLVKKAMNQLIQAYDWENITNDMLVNAMCEYKDGVEFMETRTDVDTEVQPQLNDMTNISSSSTPRSIETNASSKSSASVGTDPENVQKENEELKDLYTCKICLDERVGITFVPCGHLVTCKTCSPKIRRCPLCRTFIRGTIKTVV